MPPRDEFIKLARKVGFHYSICYEPTVDPSENGEDTVSIGEAAHITAAAPCGPSYDPTLTSEERASECTLACNPFLPRPPVILRRLPTPSAMDVQRRLLIQLKMMN